MKNSLKKAISMALVLAIFAVAGSAMIMTDREALAAGDNVTVTLSDTAPSATGVTYTVLIEFGVEETIATGENVNLDLDAVYDGSSGLLETAAATATGFGCTVTASSSTIDCVVEDSDFTGNQVEIVITDVENPAKDNPVGEADTYNVRTTIPSLWGDGFIDAMYAIVEPVEVTAEVQAILEFQIYGVEGNDGQNVDSTGTVIEDGSSPYEEHPSWSSNVNGAPLTGTLTTRPDVIDFGILASGTQNVVAQDLRVVTNASEGYTVTVFQDQDLTSLQGDTINPFGEWATDTLTPYEPRLANDWTSPVADIDHPDTWSYFGFTSQDPSLEYDAEYRCGTAYDEGTAASYFNSSGNTLDNVWAGFNASAPEAVMCHVGPSDGTTENVGMTRIGYALEISPLQPAGQYTNTLTYVATPTF